MSTLLLNPKNYAKHVDIWQKRYTPEFFDICEAYYCVLFEIQLSKYQKESVSVRVEGGVPWRFNAKKSSLWCTMVIKTLEKQICTYTHTENLYN